MYKNIPAGGFSFCLRKFAVSSVGIGDAQTEVIPTARVTTRDGVIAFGCSLIAFELFVSNWCVAEFDTHIARDHSTLTVKQHFPVTFVDKDIISLFAVGGG